ncbi:MAG: hypothetical protein J6N76_06720, partial [Lachnospiraceae bacterium]|nr:hypothetical protein [Lachnospiraceae bacterium]
QSERNSASKELRDRVIRQKRVREMPDPGRSSLDKFGTIRINDTSGKGKSGFTFSKLDAAGKLEAKKDELRKRKEEIEDRIGGKKYGIAKKLDGDLIKRGEKDLEEGSKFEFVEDPKMFFGKRIIIRDTLKRWQKEWKLEDEQDDQEYQRLIYGKDAAEVRELAANREKDRSEKERARKRKTDNLETDFKKIDKAVVKKAGADFMIKLGLNPNQKRGFTYQDYVKSLEHMKKAASTLKGEAKREALAQAQEDNSEFYAFLALTRELEQVRSKRAHTQHEQNAAMREAKQAIADIDLTKDKPVLRDDSNSELRELQDKNRKLSLDALYANEPEDPKKKKLKEKKESGFGDAEDVISRRPKLSDAMLELEEEDQHERLRKESRKEKRGSSLILSLTDQFMDDAESDITKELAPRKSKEDSDREVDPNDPGSGRTLRLGNDLEYLRKTDPEQYVLKVHDDPEIMAELRDNKPDEFNSVNTAYIEIMRQKDQSKYFEAASKDSAYMENLKQQDFEEYCRVKLNSDPGYQRLIKLRSDLTGLLEGKDSSGDVEWDKALPLTEELLKLADEFINLLLNGGPEYLMGGEETAKNAIGFAVRIDLWNRGCIEDLTDLSDIEGYGMSTDFIFGESDPVKQDREKREADKQKREEERKRIEEEERQHKAGIEKRTKELTKLVGAALNAFQDNVQNNPLGIEGIDEKTLYENLENLVKVSNQFLELSRDSAFKQLPSAQAAVDGLMINLKVALWYDFRHRGIFNSEDNELTDEQVLKIIANYVPGKNTLDGGIVDEAPNMEEKEKKQDKINAILDQQEEEVKTQLRQEEKEEEDEPQGVPDGEKEEEKNTEEEEEFDPNKTIEGNGEDGEGENDFLKELMDNDPVVSRITKFLALRERGNVLKSLYDHSEVTKNLEFSDEMVDYLQKHVGVKHFAQKSSRDGQEMAYLNLAILNFVNSINRPDETAEHYCYSFELMKLAIRGYNNSSLIGLGAKRQKQRDRFDSLMKFLQPLAARTPVHLGMLISNLFYSQPEFMAPDVLRELLGSEEKATKFKNLDIEERENILRADACNFGSLVKRFVMLKADEEQKRFFMALINNESTIDLK